MNSNPLLPDFGLGILFVAIYVIVCIAVFLIVLRIFYSVIWRAVRRGMSEYHKAHPSSPTVD